MKNISSNANARRLGISLFGTAALAALMLGTPLVHRVTAAPRTYEQALRAGQVALSSSNFEEARGDWKEAISLAANPKDKAQAQVGLARTLLNLKELPAVESLLQDLQQAPADALSKTTILGLQSQLLNAQGQTMEAAQVTKQMLETAPQQFPGIKFNPDGTLATLSTVSLSQLLYGPLIGDVTGKTSAQIQTALETLAKNPDAPNFKRQQARIYVGDILFRQGKPSEARSFYSDADLSFAASVPVLQIGLLDKIGATYIVQKEWTQAVQIYNRALAVPGISEKDEHAMRLKRDAAARLLAAQPTE